MILIDIGRTRKQPPLGGSMGRLEEVPLGAGVQQLLDDALADNNGSPEWRRRKENEARDLLALSCLAPKRMIVLQLDLSGSLRALIHLRTPVPTMQPGTDEVVIKQNVVLGLQYRQEATFLPQPGASFIQILEPEGVFLAQVPTTPPFLLCLAPTLPPGIPCKELILMAYSALSLQSYQIDARDAAGVYNADAARWWQDNSRRIPLTKQAFLDGPAAPEGSRP